MQLLLDLWPRLAKILPSPSTNPNVHNSRLKGVVMDHVDKSVMILSERETLRTQVSTIKSQAFAPQDEAEHWPWEYLLLSTRCRPYGLGKHTLFYPDPGDNSQGGLLV